MERLRAWTVGDGARTVSRALPGYAVTLIAVAAVTAVLLPVRDRLALLLTGLFFLLPVVLIAARWGWGPGLFAAVLASASLNYFFVAPLFHIKVPDPIFSLPIDEALASTVFLFIAVLTSALLSRARAGEAAAQQSQDKFAAMVDSIDGIIWEADAQTFSFEYVSRQAERLLGYPVERWLAEPTFWRDHIHPDDQEWAAEFCVRATAEHRAHEFEYRMVAADGRTVWLHDAVNVLVEHDRAVKLRGVMLDISERKRAEEQRAALSDENARLLGVVRRQLEEVRRSRQLVVAASESQRRVVAEWLHGRVQTGLLVAWHRLGLSRDLVETDPAQAAAILDDVRAALDTLREQEVRETSHLLHPSIIRIGLIPALRSLAARLDGRVDVAIEVDPALAALDDPAENQISEAARLATYRIVEEALANSLRHGAATAATVSLRLSEGRQLLLEVHDNGRGFDTTGLRSGLGLSSVAGRVDQFGGTWGIESAPGAGTTLRAVLLLVGRAAVTPLADG
jgi:PAS domain S-box-containing protein